MRPYLDDARAGWRSLARAAAQVVPGQRAVATGSQTLPVAAAIEGRKNDQNDCKDGCSINLLLLKF